MFTPRVIPSLLLSRKGLVKTVQFKNPKYIGDPINVVRIFSEKEVHELVFLSIDGVIPYDLLKQIASECYFPFSYGGGIRTIYDVSRIMNMGIEKVIFNSGVYYDPSLVSQSSHKYGSQSVVVSIDVRKKWTIRKNKREVYIQGGKRGIGIDPVTYAKFVENVGAGEIFLNCIERDGVMKGYDTELISMVSNAVHIPVVSCGGAGTLEHLQEGILAGASAVSAGSMFVYHGPLKGVLINYPSRTVLNSIFGRE